MIELAQGLQWWHWWILAAVLAALETLLPGAFAIWFAISAFVVGALLLVVPVPWQLQLVGFAALGVAALLLWRRFRPERVETFAEPLLNQRGAQYIGRVFTLVEPLADGRGKAQVGDTVWPVRGPDRPIGARVRVKGVDGTVLIVDGE